MHHIDHEIDVQVEFKLLTVIIGVLDLLRYQLVPHSKELELLTIVKSGR